MKTKHLIGLVTLTVFYFGVSILTSPVLAGGV